MITLSADLCDSLESEIVSLGVFHNTASAPYPPWLGDGATKIRAPRNEGRPEGLPLTPGLKGRPGAAALALVGAAQCSAVVIAWSHCHGSSVHAARTGAVAELTHELSGSYPSWVSAWPAND
jgi:hypothetical protein